MVMLVNSEDFSLESTDRIDYQLLSVGGCFTVKNLYQMKRCLDEILKTDIKEIVIDLKACQEIDSSGIGLVTNLYKQLKVREGALSILNSPENIYKIFKDTGLNNILSFYDSLDEVDNKYT